MVGEIAEAAMLRVGLGYLIAATLAGIWGVYETFFR